MSKDATGWQLIALDAGDIARVVSISSNAFDPRYGEAWTAAQCLSIFAFPGYRMRGIAAPDETSRRFAGFAIMRSVFDESELLLLAVDPAARRRGAGRALLDDWERQMRALSVRRLFLEMRSDNPARSLYNDFGMVATSVRPAYYRGGDGVLRDAITMERIIV